MTTAFLTPHLASALSALAGTAISVGFLACGRGVHLLDRTGSWLAGLGLFIIQVTVLGGLGALLAQYHTGLLAGPCAAAISAVSVAWIVGIVVAGRHPQRIYDDPHEHDSSIPDIPATMEDQ
ncbi:cyanate permease [Cutibacterium equinum]|uniref:cyanate permease n=1 Tax=Cutibacterium equinum TaxID=3016342 RepID=UPI002FE1DE22